MSIELRPEDQLFYKHYLHDFVPERIFDAHAHMLDLRTFPAERQEEMAGLPVVQSLEAIRNVMNWLHPGRGYAGMFFGDPEAEDLDSQNAFVSEQIRDHPQCRGHFCIRPTDDPEWVRDEVKRLGLHGLKCYHTHSAFRPIWESPISTYLPEPFWRIAHEQEWTITLHMVKRYCVADPENQQEILTLCRRYPGVRLILAHSARAFNPQHNLDGLEAIRTLDNVWFDSSANCDAMAHIAILRIFGHQRLMYGSDFWVSHLRGLPVAAGDSFVWLYENSDAWTDGPYSPKPVLVGLEHLRSLRWACWSQGLTDSQIEDIFYRNAEMLWSVNGS